MSVAEYWLPTKMCTPLIQGTCEYVTLHAKRDFAAVIKVTDLEMGRDYPGLSGWTQSNHMNT